MQHFFAPGIELQQVGGAFHLQPYGLCQVYVCQALGCILEFRTQGGQPFTASLPEPAHLLTELQAFVQVMMVCQAFADAVAASLRKVLHHPAGRDGLVHRKQMPGPDDAVMQGTIPFEGQICRKMPVAGGEIPPGQSRFRGKTPPVRTRQLEQEVILGNRKRLEGEQSGGTVHQTGIVAEVPALHDGIHLELMQQLVFLVEITRHRHKGYGCILVRAAHLQLGGGFVALPSHLPE